MTNGPSVAAGVVSIAVAIGIAVVATAAIVTVVASVVTAIIAIVAIYRRGGRIWPVIRRLRAIGS